MYNEKKYHTLIKVSYIISKVLFCLLIGAGVLAILGFIIVLFIPETVFNFAVGTIKLEIGDAIKYIISEPIDGGNVKFITLIAIVVGLVHIIFSLLLFYAVYKILAEVKNNNPFAKANVKHLYFIAFTFLAGSVLIPTFNFILGMFTIKKLNIININSEFSLNLDYIFIGLLILILANIFNYGAYLQNEYNETV
jgi:hypothetical protein